MHSTKSVLALVLFATLSAQIFQVDGWTKVKSLTHLTNYKGAQRGAVGTSCKLNIMDCGSVEGSLIQANLINGTCNGGTAILKKGTTAYIDFQFKASIDESELKSKVAGKIGPLPYVNFPLDNPDACKDSGLQCPVKANVNVDYVPHIKVLSSFPSVNVIVKWELQDVKNGKDVYCVEIPATIQS